AQALARASSPVNYVGRIATRACQLEGVAIAAGERVILMLPWANAPTCPGSSLGNMAFGAGAHVCAGQALALAIIEAYLSALKVHYATIDWKRLVPEPALHSVFHSYGEAT